ncbi:MAG: extensin family protein [Polyangiaceae bacterium]
MTVVWPLLLSLWAHQGAPLPDLSDPDQPPEGQRVFFPKDKLQRPAFIYAEMTTEECLAEADERGLPYAPGPKPPSIEAPVTLEAPLRGVSFEHWSIYQRREQARAQQHGAAGPVMDCRLLLALDDFAGVANQHNVVAVRYSSVYRGIRARRAGQRHAAGVAIDVNELILADGRSWNIKRDYEGAGVGNNTCTLSAPWPASEVARDLRRFVCGVARGGFFNLLLSPHYDRHHQDHLHLEVRRDIDWVLVQ